MPENNSRADIRHFGLNAAQADHYRAVLATYRRQRAQRLYHRNLIISNTAAATIAVMLLILVISLTLHPHL